MKFTQDTDFPGYTIHSYSEQGVEIAAPASLEQLLLDKSFIIAGDYLKREWRPQTFTDLSSDDVAELLVNDPELVLLGTGARQQFPEPSLLRPIYEAGIGIEVMDSGAACRTYNILLGEGRRVSAGIIL